VFFIFLVLPLNSPTPEIGRDSGSRAGFSVGIFVVEVCFHLLVDLQYLASTRGSLQVSPNQKHSWRIRLWSLRSTWKQEMALVSEQFIRFSTLVILQGAQGLLHLFEAACNRSFRSWGHTSDIEKVFSQSRHRSVDSDNYCWETETHFLLIATSGCRRRIVVWFRAMFAASPWFFELAAIFPVIFRSNCSQRFSQPFVLSIVHSDFPLSPDPIFIYKDASVWPRLGLELLKLFGWVLRGNAYSVENVENNSNPMVIRQNFYTSRNLRKSQQKCPEMEQSIGSKGLNVLVRAITWLWILQHTRFRTQNQEDNLHP
jgi:hypothetical protein